LHAGDGEYHVGTANKLGAVIDTVLIDDPGRAIKHPIAIATNQPTRVARGGHSAQLLRADRAPLVRGQLA